MIWGLVFCCLWLGLLGCVYDGNEKVDFSYGLRRVGVRFSFVYMRFTLVTPISYFFFIRFFSCFS